jgi:HEAT repeat protein
VADRGLTDPSVTVRVQAARALARLGGAWAVPALAAATVPTEASVVRVAATRTLGEMPFPPARAHLALLRDDDDPDVRRLATAATPSRETAGGDR